MGLSRKNGNSLLRGFASGIAVSLIVSASVLIGSRFASAQSNGDNVTIWSGLSRGANLLAGDNRNDDRHDVSWQHTAASDTTGTTTTGSSDNEADTIDTETIDNTGGAQTAPTGSGRYVALGDSVAAGLGLAPLRSATTQDNRCGRSSQSYAYQVGASLGKPVSLYACSGASSGDLFTRQWISNSNPQIQLDQAFSAGRPDVISITVGANDIGWSRLIQACYASTCGGRTQTAAVNIALRLTQHNLNKALREISDRSAGNPPTVILTGYYNPVSPQCTDLYPDRLTAAEINWIGNGVAALNQTLRGIADSHDQFVRFAAVDFTGHDLCSTNPWIQGLTDKAPIHPTSTGQQAIAAAVIRAAGN